ncbi:acVLRF1 family peptidyl-tRNA hydrolase [Nocardioides sp. WS12]|uniref:acVLRF1 family peptidyl-tRNA hydrolase n=1 Tax=Nocardioides sp. WS12 TaxID=2486272 RepID=UPI0015F78B75|nr:acVLRF1 family peptidyl-tRNA hydrolase [Nocardioides sp. WS12]
MPDVFVPVARWPRWVSNFAASHGDPVLSVVDGALLGNAPDGSHFSAHLPFSIAYDDLPDAGALADSVAVPERWGVLLVRKGGFAIARLEDRALAESKVGQRHVQGRTKAGGQSQQRFARRRDNQARAAYEAAADHAARILPGVDVVVAGGDHTAVTEVLTDARLGKVQIVGAWHAVPDPRRGVLEKVVADAQALMVQVENA